jgi:hypothetical protein
MEIGLKISNQTLIKKTFGIYSFILIVIVGVLVWGSVSEWFSNDQATNRIIAFSILGITQIGFMVYLKKFHIAEKVQVMKDGISTQQFNFIPFADIEKYSPKEFTKWTDTMSIRHTSGPEIAFTRLKKEKRRSETEFIEFCNMIKENATTPN